MDAEICAQVEEEDTLEVEENHFPVVTGDSFIFPVVTGDLFNFAVVTGDTSRWTNILLRWLGNCANTSCSG